MFSKNNDKPDEASSNDFIEYRPVLSVEKFRKYFYKQNFLLKMYGSISKSIYYFIFKILEIAQQFFQTKIYFDFNQSEDFLGDDGYLLQLLTAKGIIQRVSGGAGQGVYHDEPRLFHYVIEMGSIFTYSDAKRQNCRYASGNSFDDNRQAFLRTLGETVERFCLDCYRDKSLVTAPYGKLKERAINPLLVASLSSKQRNQKKIVIDGKSLFRWTKGYSLETGEHYWIPAQLVYVSYSLASNEPVIRIPISTGAAAGFSLEKAICEGLCEVIERDAFMISYLNRISPPQLSFDKITNPKIKNILAILKRYCFEFYFLDITTDIPVPTILAVVIDRSSVGPPISVGACANLDIFKAIEGAIVEALKIRISIRQISEGVPSEMRIQPRDIINFDNRKLFWRDPNLLQQLDFLFRGRIKELRDDDTKKDGENNAHNLKKVLDFLNKAEVESFLVDITVPPVRKAGFFVVKTVAPKLQPLYLDENIRYLGGERLYNVPVKMGWRKRPLKEEELNSLPHPFI